MADKSYRGDRTIDGAEVTVDGRLIDPRYDLKAFDSRGMEWSYEGNGPRQLALAILADHYQDDMRALADTEGFMTRIVANFGNEWAMTSADIDRALNNIKTEA